ncbi:MAG: MFS transporter [Spongiibacteraceae bacterium]|jgi:AAHS family 4-hydroxybenzoate transporter-like MFS transporter|nr:MFS transporter [Spongiibacteraceae bacterium]
MSVSSSGSSAASQAIPSAAGNGGSGDRHDAAAHLLAGARVRPHQWAMVTLIMCGLALDGLDIQLLAQVSPAILEEWSVEKSAFGPALAAALVGMAIGASLGGWLGDRFGRKTVLLGATFCFGAATALASLTGNVTEMTLLRLVSGIGFGAAGPNGMALATEWLPQRVRPRVVAILSTGVPLGGLFAAFVVMGLLPLYGWRGCFIICGLATLLLGVLMLLVLMESPSYLLARGRQARALQLLRRIIPDAELPADAASGQSKREDSPEADVRLFSRPNLLVNIGASLTFFAISCVAYAIITWTPVMLTMVGFTLNEALRGSIAYSLSAVIGAIAVSLFINRFGSRLTLLLCVALVLVSVVTLGLSLLGGNVARPEWLKWSAILSIGGIGVFTGAGLASVYALLAYAYPAACRAGGIGFGMMIGRFGAVAAIVAGGYLLEVGDASATAFVIAMGVITVAAGLGTILVDRHIPKGLARGPAAAANVTAPARPARSSA